MQSKAFTIVELLIVIVVIAILASISIVAYNGIQNRANIVKINADLNSINKAIQLYYAENGTYPSTGGGWRGTVTYGNHGSNFVPGLVPSYISNMPLPRQLSSNSDYIYNSNGTGYKLIAHDSNPGTGFQGLCASAVQITPSLADPHRNCWAWGYFTTSHTSI